jgi:translation initiation factor IF-1
MEIKEGIVLKRFDIKTFLVEIDNEEVICGMDAKLVMNYYRVIVGDKIYVKGARIMEPREMMLYKLQWSSSHSPISPEDYKRRFKEEDDSPS